jgi:general secretion pathway protein G
MNIKRHSHSQPGLNRRRRAFTLVELLLVLSILALLAGLVLPKLAGTGEKAKVKTTIAQIGSFKSALDMFEVENGKYPPGRNGLNDLVTKPRYASTDWHQYMDKIPADPWGNAYIYECPGRHNPNSFDLSSAGPDGVPGNDDDICNWDRNTR